MKNILITGAGGFIGSHLTELLVKKGYNVKVFLHYNSKTNYGWLEDLNIINQIELVFGDIRDYDSTYKALVGTDTVFHLAALIGIPYSYFSPLAYIQTNHIGTYNILESSKNLGLENIILTSTSETYGSAQYVPIDEKHPFVGQSPYSASKIAADQLAISYKLSFQLPIKIVRPFNTYGPRQSARAIIPSIISQILYGNKTINLGITNTTRDFTFISDTVNGFYFVSKIQDEKETVFNLGNNKEISILNLINKISKLLELDVEVFEDKQRFRPENSEVNRLICDNRKIKKFTTWEPIISLDEGIISTFNWIKENINYFKKGIYNV